MSGTSGDAFDILSQELIALRRSVEHLARTSLDKDDAEKLNVIVAEAVEDMHTAITEAPEAIQGALKADRDRMALTASQAATEAAERVMGDMRNQLTQERLRFSQAAGEARREAWRYFGGIWVWGGLLLSLGAILGGSGVFWIQGRADAKEFARYPGLFCDVAKGSMIEAGNSGWVYCAVPVRESTPEAN